MSQPAVGASYPQLLRTTDHTWWKSVAGALLAVSMYFLLSMVVIQSVIGIGWWLSGRPDEFAAYYGTAVAFERPVGMLAANLAIAAMIGVCWLLVSSLHGLQPRWLSSVGPRLRWRYLFACLAVAVVVMAAFQFLPALTGPGLELVPQQGFLGFLIVIVLTSPLQAAAEEYLFRGYLLQAFGSITSTPWFGVVVSALVFAFFHGTQNLPLFVDRFAFGLVAGALVLKTGGLEAGIAAHVVNNLMAWLLAGLTSSVAAVRALSSIGWGEALVDVGGFAAFALVAWWVATRLRLRTVVADTSS